MGHKWSSGRKEDLRESSARRRVYERLKDYAAHVKGSYFDIKTFHVAIDEIDEAPLTEVSQNPRKC